MRYLVIGDIHGVLHKVQAFEQYFNQVDMTIFVGDFIDRGNQPLEVLEYVLQVPNSIRLLGNHEFKYWKKIKAGKETYPSDVTAEQFPKFADLLTKAVGDKPTYFYKDENIGVSHAPAALWQHDWTTIPKDKYVFGWTTGEKDASGYPRRLTLEEKFPNEVTQKPVVFGHIHENKICLGNNLYCVDLDCGNGGFLGGVIIENTTIVDMIKI